MPRGVYKRKGAQKQAPPAESAANIRKMANDIGRAAGHATLDARPASLIVKRVLARDDHGNDYILDVKSKTWYRIKPFE